MPVAFADLVTKKATKMDWTFQSWEFILHICSFIMLLRKKTQLEEDFGSQLSK